MKDVLLFLSCSLAGIILLPVFLLNFPPVINQPLISPAVQNSLPSKNSLTFSPAVAPSDSLKGNILSLSGRVDWQSRIATEPAQLTTNIPLQQGEVVKTLTDGQIGIEFPGAATLTLSPNSEVNLAQTLPLNLVFVQKSGLVSYEKTGLFPLSVRAFHLLIDQNSGEINVTVDQENHTVSVNAAKGTANVAFNDSQNLSHVLQIPEGKHYFFDDDNRLGSLKNR